MHAMSKNFVFFLFKDGADLRWRVFLVSKVCSIAHFNMWCEWLHLIDDLPFDVEVDVFVF